MKKIFVLDTNVLLHNPSAIFAFADNEVVLPIEVIEELDIFKKDNDEKGRNARTAIRALDEMRERGRLGEGVPLDSGGILKIITRIDIQELPFTLSLQERDNKILMVACSLQQKGETVIFVSKDINARIKADALGIRSMDFEKQKVDFEKLYTGWREFTVQKELIDALSSKKRLETQESFFPNEFVLLKDRESQKLTALCKYKFELKSFVALRPDPSEVWGIKPRNKEQTIAFDLLLDDDIKLVTLVGKAGTGKTLLALAAGLKKTIDDHIYKKMLVSRPVIPIGRDIGYLPGTKEEKLIHWMHPIFDNLEYILTIRKRKESVEDLIETELLQLEALTYMRGRSIPNQFIIIDEAQNLTPHEIKTVISRAGSYTKMVLTGDPYQIDNPYLDASSNGLTYAVERMKGQPMFGHIMLTKNERSGLASLAAELL